MVRAIQWGSTFFTYVTMKLQIEIHVYDAYVNNGNHIYIYEYYASYGNKLASTSIELEVDLRITF